MEPECPKYGDLFFRKGQQIMTNTAAHHQGMSKMSRLCFKVFELLLLFFFFFPLMLKGNLFISCLARLTLIELGGF